MRANKGNKPTRASGSKKIDSISKKSTVKNKLVPRSQQNRLHQKKDTHNKGSKNVPQGQQNRLHDRKSTVRNKVVPRSQQNRLYLNEDTQKGKQNRVSRSTKSTSPKEEHCKK